MKQGNLDHLYGFRSYYAGKKVSDPLGLDIASKEAVSKWRFTPATKNGKAVAATTTVDLGFKGPPAAAG